MLPLSNQVLTAATLAGSEHDAFSLSPTSIHLSPTLPRFNRASTTVEARRAVDRRFKIPLVQGNDVGMQYRSRIYFYTPEQEKAALESMERQQKLLNRKIVTEILPAKKFYRAEEYHQQYLARGSRFGFKQSSEKGCNNPIRCYG